MHTFKLKPKPQSDYRLEVKEIKKKCKLEKYGYRHNKIVYGFFNELFDLTELQSLGLNIEEITFDEEQLNLSNSLLARGRVKLRVEHLKNEREKKGIGNNLEETVAQQKLTNLNNKIQSAKEYLGITGTLKILNF